MKRILLYVVVSVFITASYAQQTVGLFVMDSTAFQGYTLLAPFIGTNTYLLNNCGHVVNQWESNHKPGASVYLTNEGKLLRTVHLQNQRFDIAGGNGGGIELYDWSGNRTWFANLSSDSFSQHHDIELLPNGNILVLIWKYVSMDKAISLGRNPAFIGEGIWTEEVWEIKPQKDSGYSVVWKWSALDHIVQDFDNEKPNYGSIEANPQLIDFNSPLISNFEDWLHFNSIDYNEGLDQIMLSCHSYSEIYIIDHSTNSSQSGGHIGGDAKKGGDLLYRYGNPSAYGRGTKADQVSFKQHDAQWIPEGYTNAGKIVFFNNGGARKYSSIDMFAPNVSLDGEYILEGSKPFQPQSPEWRYVNPDTLKFFSVNMSGVQPLPNGGFLICESTKGKVFEINSNNKIVWEYVSPENVFGRIKQGAPANGNQVFRSYKYSVNDARFNNKSLTDVGRIELDPLPIFCDDTTTTQNPDTTTALIQKLNRNTSYLYPNPFNNSLNLNGTGKQVEITIVSTSGIEVYRSSVSSGQNIDVSLLSSGLYVAVLKDEQGRVVATQKLLKTI